MDSNIIKVGDKIDIRILQQADQEEMTGQMRRVYKSKIQDIRANGLIEVSMPTEGGKMALLSTGLRYEFIFYTKSGLYRCVAQVKDRYKNNNLFMLLIEPKSALEKFQRREYFRFECVVDMEYQHITEEEARIEDIEKLKQHHGKAAPEDKLKEGIAVDLSGGGIRFTGDEPGEKGDFLFISMLLRCIDVNYLLEVAGRVLTCSKVETADPNVQRGIKKYEYRVQFLTRDQRKRETIIKYIFEQERKNRQKG